MALLLTLFYANYEAVETIDAGDSEALQQLLAEYPELATVRGYFDECRVLRVPLILNFRGATLLHHAAGEPQRAPLPENAVELAEALLSAGADPNAATYDSSSVLDLAIRSAQLGWAGSKDEMIQLLATEGVDLERNRGQVMWDALI